MKKRSPVQLNPLVHRKALTLSAFSGISIGTFVEQLINEKYAASGLPEPAIDQQPIAKAS